MQPEQVRTLKFLRFSVVEQVANASDSQCQRMGMDGAGLRERAKLALRARMNVEMQQEMKKKDAELTALRAADADKDERLKKMEAFMAQMMAAGEKPAPLKARSG